MEAVVGRSHLPALPSLGKSGAGAGLSSIQTGLGVGLSGPAPEDKGISSGWSSGNGSGDMHTGSAAPPWGWDSPPQP